MIYYNVMISTRMILTRTLEGKDAGTEDLNKIYNCGKDCHMIISWAAVCQNIDR